VPAALPRHRLQLHALHLKVIPACSQDCLLAPQDGLLAPQNCLLTRLQLHALHKKQRPVLALQRGRKSAAAADPQPALHEFGDARNAELAEQGALLFFL